VKVAADPPATTCGLWCGFHALNDVLLALVALVARYWRHLLYSATPIFLRTCAVGGRNGPLVMQRGASDRLYSFCRAPPHPRACARGLTQPMQHAVVWVDPLQSRQRPSAKSARREGPKVGPTAVVTQTQFAIEDESQSAAQRRPPSGPVAFDAAILNTSGPAGRFSRSDVDTHPILADEPSPAPWVGLGRERGGRDRRSWDARPTRGDLAQKSGGCSANQMLRNASRLRTPG